MEEKVSYKINFDEYLNYLSREEKSNLTVEKYTRDLQCFFRFLGAGTEISKERVIEFKSYLGEHYKTSSANSMLAAVNGFLSWMGMENCRVKSFKCQRKIFCDKEKELNRLEYERLVQAARTKGDKKIEMIMQTICGTGIRISELSFITVEAALQGQAVVAAKGKSRIIFITSKLRKYLLKYCREEGIKTGMIFVRKNGMAVGRTTVWKAMKAICSAAGVDSRKVFPHNLRHLFARTCYSKKKDIVYLADILGHSNIETTRIYTISSGKEHEQLIGSLKLII